MLIQGINCQVSHSYKSNRHVKIKDVALVTTGISLQIKPCKKGTATQTLKAPQPTQKTENEVKEKSKGKGQALEHVP